MNVIIANRQKDKLNNLNIEVIKRLDGEFDVNEIISSFKNIFYNKMILDITALKNYTDINTIQKLSMSLEMDKLILLLEEGNEVTSPSFLSKLISIGIYNFTTNQEGIMYLYNNPNTYRDVAQYHHIVEPEVKTVVKTVEVPVAVAGPVQYVQQQPVQMGSIVLGIKSVTQGAGATTLAYMMKKVIEKYKDVVCIEVDKTEFRYFNDRSLISATSNNIGNVVREHNNKPVIIVDINNSSVAEGLCDKVIYLLEPSTIKLNKLITLKPSALRDLKNKNVVLVKSPLNPKDIKELAYEANINIFFNLPLLDERIQNPEIEALLRKLNII